MYSVIILCNCYGLQFKYGTTIRNLTNNTVTLLYDIGLCYAWYWFNVTVRLGLGTPSLHLTMVLYKAHLVPLSISLVEFIEEVVSLTALQQSLSIVKQTKLDS